MITAFKNTYNSISTMLCVLIFPGIMTIIYNETVLEYVGRTLFSFVVFVIIEAATEKIKKKSTQK